MDKRKMAFIKLLEDICQEENIVMNTYSNYWIVELQKDDKVQYVLGYNFELNSAACSMLCNDKVGTALLLDKSGIPCVKHEMLISPILMPSYLVNDNQYELVRKFFDVTKDIVLKPNNGTGGRDVYRINDSDELEEMIDKLFKSYTHVAMGKFENIVNEYRLIVVNDTVMVEFRKEIQNVIGNGIYSVKELCENNNILVNNGIDGDYIPKEKEIYKLNWKHNLALGASPQDILDLNLKKELEKLAIDACRVLRINAASVDIVETLEGLKILEVNNGVMMDNYALYDEKNYLKAKEVYREIIKNVFEK